jgi:DNA repair protein RecO (recombination protein O)
VAYHVYHTEAIVLESRPYGEGDKLLFCYTRDLGLVVVHAKSLREIRSRLRFSLTTFARAHIDIIRGKHGWKLVSARPIDSHASLLRDPKKRRVIAHKASLLLRLIQGEERHERLFDDIVDALRAVRDIDEEDGLFAAEILFATRLLDFLGYWKGSEELAPLLAADAWTKDAPIALISSDRDRVLKEVNAALRASQL